MSKRKDLKGSPVGYLTGDVPETLIRVYTRMYSRVSSCVAHVYVPMSYVVCLPYLSPENALTIDA